MKIQNALVSNILDRSQRYFAHVTTVTLSWRVQNIVVIGRVYLTLECFEFSSNFEFDRNMLSGTGARPLCVNTLSRGEVLTRYLSLLVSTIPANTKCTEHVIVTTKRCFDVIITCLLRYVFAVMSPISFGEIWNQNTTIYIRVISLSNVISYK